MIRSTRLLLDDNCIENISMLLQYFSCIDATDSAHVSILYYSHCERRVVSALQQQSRKAWHCMPIPCEQRRAAHKTAYCREGRRGSDNAYDSIAMRAKSAA